MFTLYEIIIITTALVTTNIISWCCGYARRDREQKAKELVGSLEDVS